MITSASRAPGILLFDLGGVLVRNTGPSRLAELAPDGDDSIAARWLASPTVRAFEGGKLEATEFARRIVGEWKLALGADEFLAEFSTWPKGFYPGAEDLLAQLRGEFRLACLSNSNSLHWPRLQDIRANFELALASHELGAVKPDAACFVAALDRLGASPRDVAFFDDAPANVAAASALGMQAFCVDGPDVIRARLAAEGWTRTPRLRVS